MNAEYRCYRCGESLNHLLSPWSRRDECPNCENHLHVCRMCLHHSATAPGQCLEDDAEDVKEKERANFCEWFKPSATAFDPSRRQAAELAEAKLAGLFDDGSARDDRGSELSAAEKLFRD